MFQTNGCIPLCNIANRWVVAATKASDLSKAANKDTCGRSGRHLPEGHRWWTCRRGWCANAYRGTALYWWRAPRERTHVLGKTIGKQHDFGEKIINNLQQEGIKKSTLHYPYTEKSQRSFSWMQWYESLEGVARAFPNFTHASMM